MESNNKHPRIVFRSCRLVLLLFLSLCVLDGCSFVRLRQDVQISKDSCLLFGEVFSKSTLKRPIVVVAYEVRGDSVTIGDYALLSEPGPYELLVRPGSFRIFAFEDTNGNLAYDEGEWGGPYEKGKLLSPQPGGVEWGLDLELSAGYDRTAPAFAAPLNSYSEGRKKPFTSAGAITDLDGPAFSAEQGKKGLWAPLDSFKLTGCNIFFLEPYDRGKIPLLLVHGAAGSPQDWRYFINNIDRSRYQPWIFYYPSGARLGTVSLFLRKKLYDLDRKYAPEQLIVVAHSMGGLVARSALIEKDPLNRAVRLFVSISTPWGGEPLAKMGLAAPAVVPSWKDMVPDSVFIHDIFAAKLPDSIRYYLFFGHKGGGSIFRQNNDNTVTLESMLDPRAQAEALKVMGFNEDHISIINSAEVMAQFKAVLDATEANLKKTISSTRGYVDIRHTFRPPDAKVPLQMSFVLAPAGSDEQETQLKVNPFLARQETGAVAPGEYEASLCALGFRTEPANIPLSVKAGKISEVSYTLVPQGMVAGVITAGVAAGDSYWGFIPGLAKNVTVRAVTLAGTNYKRTLSPSDNMSDRELLRTFLASKDILCRSGFAFFDVPAGEYSLSIEADGYETLATKVTAQPGEFNPPPPFRLIKK